MGDQPVKLKYHQATFDLLDERPVLSQAALRQIEAWERRHKVSLPASIREWYSLEGAEERLRYGDSTTGILQDTPLRKKLQEVAKQFRTREPGSFTGFPVVPGDEETAYYARLDRAADPRVHSCWYPYEWGSPATGSFSGFVFRWVWDHFTCYRPAARDLSLFAVEPTFSPMELDYLIDHFSEGHHQFAFRGRREMRNPFTGEIRKVYPRRFHFFDRTARVRVSCQGNPAREETEARWEIHGNSRDALFQAALRLWPCGTLSETLAAETRRAKAVLKRLRQKFGKA
jgi:hypothetical protein